MFNEIGSEFWLNDTPDELDSEIPDWINQFGNATLTSSGRGAISLFLQKIQPKFKTALLPAYVCDSVIIPFIEQGYICYYYDLNERLIPDIESINSYNDMGVFFHMGYYGFPTNNQLSDVIQKLKAKGSIIIEDVTHTLYSDYNRSEYNDYYVASLRKWFGLPSGGVLVSVNGYISEPSELNEYLADIRRQALLIKGDYIVRPNAALKSQYLSLFELGEEFLDRDVTPYQIDVISKKLIGTLNSSRLIEKRRENFSILFEGIRLMNYIDSVFLSLPDNVCPMFFPIYLNTNRNKIRQRLIEHEIYCPIHWPIPSQIGHIQDRNALEIYNKILSIPCDQRYGTKDMERIISTLRIELQ
jgi:hypothetical protein